MDYQNLLKNPQTNWKYISIIAILALLVGGGILGYQYWWLPRQEKCEICELSFIKWCENCRSLNWPRGNQNSPILPIDNVMCMKDCFNVLLPKTNYCFDRQNLCKDFGVTESEEAKDETADWKVYKNEKYGFEMKFPREFGLLSDYDVSLMSKQIPADLDSGVIGLDLKPAIAFYIYTEEVRNQTEIEEYHPDAEIKRLHKGYWYIVEKHPWWIKYGGQESVLDQILSTFRFLE